MFHVKHGTAILFKNMKQQERRGVLVCLKIEKM